VYHERPKQKNYFNIWLKCQLADLNSAAGIFYFNQAGIN
jgi:hypothetical protein